MKKVWIAISLLVVILSTILVLANMDNVNVSDEELLIQDGLKTFTEEFCVDNLGNKTCTEKTYVQCNGERYNVPGPTGFVVYNKIYVNNSNEKKIFEEILKGDEKPSPSDRISDSDLYISNNRVRIEIEDVSWRNLIDSNSMDPLLDNGTTTIEIKPKNSEKIQAGDIIAYNSDEYNITLVHRVVEVGNDAGGIYFITKGDNYNQNDKAKVRFSQVEGIVVGILY
tara:strand:- start:2689 stop:3363 length:675 start_codon:yes stop_codon:yes gene_type:complete